MTEEAANIVATITWTPSHHLSPRQERKRIEKAEAKLAELVGILSAPIEGDAD